MDNLKIYFIILPCFSQFIKILIIIINIYVIKMSKCGNIKDDLKENKVYDCLKCKTKMDRDINGSRNIYMVAINK
jgi:transposase